MNSRESFTSWVHSTSDQDLQRLVIVARSAFPFFIFPVRGDTFFGGQMHLLGADLHFERLTFPSDDRGMQRLVEIVAWGGYPVLEAAWHRFPGGMNHAQSCIAVANFIRRNYSGSHEIVNPIRPNF